MGKTRKNLKKIWRKVRIPVIFTATFVLIQFCATLIVFIVCSILYLLGFISDEHVTADIVMIFFTICFITSALLAYVLGRAIMVPLNDYVDAIDEVARGNYSVRVKVSDTERFRIFGERFNNMVSKLENVEVLGNDFVNNFSHEFKTPIVSIRGFAKMLKDED